MCIGDSLMSLKKIEELAIVNEDEAIIQSVKSLTLILALEMREIMRRVVRKKECYFVENKEDNEAIE